MTVTRTTSIPATTEDNIQVNDPLDITLLLPVSTDEPINGGYKTIYKHTGGTDTMPVTVTVFNQVLQRGGQPVHRVSIRLDHVHRIYDDVTYEEELFEVAANISFETKGRETMVCPGEFLHAASLLVLLLADNTAPAAILDEVLMGHLSLGASNVYS